METEENDGGGESLILVDGDDLDQVPEPYRKLLTRPIREAFADPPAYFRAVAERCPFPTMAERLRALIDGGQWDLALHRGDPPVDVEWAEIAPPHDAVPADLPPALRVFDSLVDRGPDFEFDRRSIVALLTRFQLIFFK